MVITAARLRAVQEKCDRTAYEAQVAQAERAELVRSARKEGVCAERGAEVKAGTDVVIGEALGVDPSRVTRAAQSYPSGPPDPPRTIQADGLPLMVAPMEVAADGTVTIGNPRLAAMLRKDSQ